MSKQDWYIKPSAHVAIETNRYARDHKTSITASGKELSQDILYFKSLNLLHVVTNFSCLGNVNLSSTKNNNAESQKIFDSPFELKFSLCVTLPLGLIGTV